MTPVVATLVLIATLLGSPDPAPAAVGAGTGGPPAVTATSAPGCAASWGRSGPLGALFAIPRAPAGVDVCGPGTLRPAPVPGDCTRSVPIAVLQTTLNSANPGDRICTRGDLSRRLTVTRSGTAAAPIEILGIGQTSVSGVTINASHVVLAGFNSTGAVAPGIQLTGEDITALNNTVTSPRGGNGDGIAFFGRNLRILHNTISDVRNLGGAQADCLQTYATDTASQDVLISSNRCTRIDSQCLIAEGPHSIAGDGTNTGASADITFTNNVCDSAAAQALTFDDVQNVAVTNNVISGQSRTAIVLANNSTGATVAGNAVAPMIDCVVSADTSSRQGYRGPPPGANP